MRCRSIALLAVLGLSLSLGCGGSSAPAPTAGAASAAPADPIARVVYEFFDAVKRGQATEANQLLTPLALQRITESGMNIAPPGSATATFNVEGVQQRQGDHALVTSTWTDLDPDGKPISEPIAFELRDVGGGQWRICGMAQDRGPNLPPMVIDFETFAANAPQAQAKAVPGAGAPATASGAIPTTESKQVAQDPFLQPVQR